MGHLIVNRLEMRNSYRYDERYNLLNGLREIRADQQTTLTLILTDGKQSCHPWTTETQETSQENWLNGSKKAMT